MGVCICLWPSEDNFGDILRKPSLWKGFSLSWNLPTRLVGLASKPQGPSRLFLPSTGIMSMCHHAWHFDMTSEDETYVFMFAKRVLSHVSYFFNPEKKIINENKMKANRQNSTWGGRVWMMGGTRDTSPVSMSSKELGRFWNYWHREQC